MPEDYLHHAEGQWPRPLNKKGDPAGPYGPTDHHIPGDVELPSWEEQVAEVEKPDPYKDSFAPQAEKLKDKVKVVASSTVTLLSGLAVLITLYSADIAALFPENAEDIARWSTVVVGWLGTAITALRRVTPVPGRLHGILPDPKVKVPS